MEMTVDLRKSPQRCFPSPPSTTLLPPLKSSGFWDPLAHRNKDKLPKKTHHQEGTAEVQPTSTAANPLLQCNYLVCSVCIHHLLTWVSHQTGHECTAMDNQRCRKNRCQPVLQGIRVYTPPLSSAFTLGVTHFSVKLIWILNRTWMLKNTSAV